MKIGHMQMKTHELFDFSLLEKACSGVFNCIDVKLT